MSRNVGYTTGYKGYWTNFDHPEAPIEIAYQMTLAQEQKLLDKVDELEPEVFEKSNVIRPSMMRIKQLDDNIVRYFLIVELKILYMNLWGIYLMKNRQIDLFFLKIYNSIVMKVTYNEQDTRKNFAEYLADNKDFLVRKYVEQRRELRRVK